MKACLLTGGLKPSLLLFKAAAESKLVQFLYGNELKQVSPQYFLFRDLFYIFAYGASWEKVMYY